MPRSVLTSLKILTAVLVIALVGCGADRPERADTVRGPTPTLQEDVEEADTLTQRQVESALLAVEDMPTGWSMDTPEDSDSEDVIEPAECGALFEALDKAPDPVAKAEAVFTAGGFGPFLEHGVTAFDESAADQLDQVVDTLNQCPEFSSTDAEGVTTEFTTAPLSFPNLGDRTLALRFQGSTGGIDVVVDTIFIAIGSNGISLVVGGLVPMEGAELESIATTAVEKLNDAIDNA
jgi:hypothetical protein